MTTNNLPASSSLWTSSSGFVVTSLLVDSDLSGDAIKIDVSYDTVPTDSAAEIKTNLDIVYANSYYNMSLCYQFTQETQDVSEYPVSIYLRQKNYPFQPLTSTQSITAKFNNQQCSTLSLKTLEGGILMNLVDYAELVFDLAPNLAILNDASLAGFILSFSQMRLVTGTITYTQPTKTQPQTVYNIK